MMKPATPVASAILDDFESRPGSVTSLSRTVLGAFIRQLDGWTSIAHFTELMAALGISPQSTRTAVNRLKTKGILESENRDGRVGYRLTPDAADMLTRGYARVFDFRQMHTDDPWRVLAFSIPESGRADRTRLRRRLTGIGCGTLNAGMLICPDYMTEEVAAIVTALELDDFVTTFRATDISTVYGLATAIGQWWDLDALRARHVDFIEHHGTTLPPQPSTTADSFARFVGMLDEWRVIPLLDPGLPADLLPDNWPGKESVRVFDTIKAQLLEPSREWVKAIMSS